MLNRYKKYYAVGSRVTYRTQGAFHTEADWVDFNYHDITQEDLRGSIHNQNEIELFNNFEAVKPFATVEGPGWEWFQKTIYKCPLFEVYILDESKLTQKDGKTYTLPTNMAVHQVWVKYHAEFEPLADIYFPKTYTALFAKHSVEHTEKNSITENVKAIFNDYSHPKVGLFLSCNWNRHHTKLADHIRDNLPSNPEDAYQYLIEQRDSLMSTNNNVNHTGSFMRRIDFALAELATHLNVSEHNKQLKA